MRSRLTSRVNTLRPRQNGRHFADDIFKRIFLNENILIPIKISLTFVPRGSINTIPALVQIMAWRRPGDKPLSEPMMVNLPTHICVTRPQWVKVGYITCHAIRRWMEDVISPSWNNVRLAMHTLGSDCIASGKSLKRLQTKRRLLLCVCIADITQASRIDYSFPKHLTNSETAQLLSYTEYMQGQWAEEPMMLIFSPKNHTRPVGHPKVRNLLCHIVLSIFPTSARSLPSHWRNYITAPVLVKHLWSTYVNEYTSLPHTNAETNTKLRQHKYVACRNSRIMCLFV